MNEISYSQMRIQETAQSFRKLYKIYSRNETAVENVASIQLKETAKLLEEATGINLTFYPYNKRFHKKLMHIMASNGINLDSIVMYKSQNDRLEISVVIRTFKHECISAASIAGILSEYCKKTMVPQKGGRTVITDRWGEFIFEEAAKYFTLYGTAAASKEKNSVSGDSYTVVNERHGRMSIALADGMGTGIRANRTSREVIELMEQFFEAGFSEENVIKMINSALSSRDEDDPVTLDLAAIDLSNAECSFFKAGAAASYIKTQNEVKVIKPSSLPAGVLENVNPDVTHIQLKNGEYIIMVSDGITDSLPFYDKEQHFAKIINELECDNPRVMAEALLEEAMFYQGISRKDDMTVLVVGVWKSRNS